MSAWSEVDDTECPIARSQSLVGERWTIFVIRELFMGVTRFDDIQAQTGATPQMLAARLKKLEEAGLIERRPYSARPLRYEYGRRKWAWISIPSFSRCADGEKNGASPAPKESRFDIHTFRVDRIPASGWFASPVGWN